MILLCALWATGIFFFVAFSWLGKSIKDYHNSVKEYDAACRKYKKVLDDYAIFLKLPAAGTESSVNLGEDHATSK